MPHFPSKRSCGHDELKPDACAVCRGYVPHKMNSNDPDRYNLSHYEVGTMAAARLPCAYEGDVVSWSTDGDERKHVRHCLHPAAEWDTCTRAASCGKTKPKDRQFCATCPSEYYRERTGPKISLNMGAGGLGDGILGLLVCAALKRENPDTHITYKVGEKAYPFVRYFRGYDQLALHDWDRHGTYRLAILGDRQLNYGYQLEMATRGKQARWERYLENAGVLGGPVIPELQSPHSIHSAGDRFAGSIILCPFTAWSDREYPLERWLALDQRLRETGRRTILIHNDHERTLPFQCEKLIGQSPVMIMGALARSAAVIGQDSGLSHLAAVLGAKTIILCGQTRGEKIFGAYPRTRSLYGPMPCNGCYWNYPNQKETCTPHCPSLSQIDISAIMAAIESEW